MNTRKIQIVGLLFLLATVFLPAIGGATTGGIATGGVATGGVAIKETKVAGAEYFASFLRSAVEDHLTDQYSGAGRSIEKMTIIVPKSYTPPPSFDDLAIKIPYQNRSGRKVFITVSVMNGGSVVSRLNVMAEVALSMEMVVAVRDIKRDSIIQKEDVAIERRTTGPGFRMVALTLDQVVGKKVGRSLRLGTLLRVDQLVTPLMVNSGDMVTVVAENGRMRITTMAKAKESGNVGQWIRIQNIESKKQFSAKITGPGLVAVHF